jgi:hypothetical protein
MVGQLNIDNERKLVLVEQRLANVEEIVGDMELALKL